METLMIIFFIILWIFSSLSAYPRYKNFWTNSNIYQEHSDYKNWTNGRMIWAIIVCLLVWWLIWLYIFSIKTENWFDNWEWRKKKSNF